MLAGQVFLIGILWAYFLAGHGDFQPGGFSRKTSSVNLQIILADDFGYCC